MRTIEKIIESSMYKVSTILDEKWEDDEPYPIKELGAALETNNMEDIMDSIYGEITSRHIRYKWAIERIYDAIVQMKYLSTSNNGDTYLRNTLIINAIWLREEIKNNKYAMYYIEKISKEVYNAILEDYKDREVPIDIEEECKFEHLTDVNYHLANFARYCPDDPDITRPYNILKDYNL